MVIPAIQVKSLVKTYGDIKAVDDVSFEVPQGVIFSLLGPNGAGKTTLVEMVETIRKPTKGKVFVLGMDAQKRKRDVIKRIGVLPQEFSSFRRLTVYETLKYFISLFDGKAAADELLSLVALTEVKDRLYQNLSGGLKQRVGVAVSLVNDPEVVFLDEPTTGLDPSSRRDVWEVIKGLKEKGKTIILTTHYMEEAEALSDIVAIISKGKIITIGSPEELIEKYSHFTYVRVKGKKDPLIEASRGFPLEVNKDGITIKCDSFEKVVKLLNRFRDNGVVYQNLDIRRANLEEVFLTLTGEMLKEERRK